MDVKLISVSRGMPEFGKSAESLIAYCARVSSTNQSNLDYEKLFKYLIDHRHWSPFEMADMTVEIVTSRAIAPQILRHKSFQFQEFCISGETLITTIGDAGRTKKIPIKKLYAYQSDPRMSVVWKKGIRVYDEEAKVFVQAKVKEVFKTGVKKTFTVSLEDGKTIRTTQEHKFLVHGKGFVCLQNIHVGDLVAVNGQPLHMDKDWMLAEKEKAIRKGTGLKGVSDAAGISYYTAKKWLRVHGLQFTKKETASYTTIWNKGLSPEQQPGYRRLKTDETREKSTPERVSAKKTVRWKKVARIEYFGEEETYDLEVGHTSHNYVANGICVHNSQRYAKVQNLEYVELRAQGDTKQGSAEVLEDDHLRALVNNATVFCSIVYDELIEAGVSRETARMVLPLATQTRIYMKGSVRSWIHYLQVRLADDTQKEHRDIAEAVKAIFVEQFPITAKALQWT